MNAVRAVDFTRTRSLRGLPRRLIGRAGQNVPGPPIDQGAKAMRGGELGLPKFIVGCKSEAHCAESSAA